MATSGEFLSFVLDRCAGLPVRTRPMMGELLEAIYPELPMPKPGKGNKA